MATTTKKRKKPTSSAARKKAKKKNGGKKNSKTVITLILCAAILSIIAAGVFIITQGSKSAKNNPAPLKGEVAWGIDVSNHNGKINWKKVSEKAEFTFIRVGARGYSRGEIYPDTTYKYNLKHAEKYGVPAGVYFYSQATNEKEAQEEAAFALKAIKGYSVSLPVVIDFEYPTVNGSHAGRLFNAGLTKKERTAVINAFCDRVRKAGYTPGIYASSYIYRTELNMKDIPDDVFIWVADYNKEVTYTGYYDIWQYSETGSCDGIKGNVDTNHFYIKNRKSK
ncbi:MAG: glycoside hydrolase family 25 protein [Eubacterium sp.]|nr:glycoside hydrolase family 25 protein [Eubacterium sp.]